MDFLYNTVLGRCILNIMLHTGILKISAKWLHTKSSRCLVDTYIRKNRIDMSDFKGQKFKSFADFFGRTKDIKFQDPGKNVLISPCDSLLSTYSIDENATFEIKGVHYRLEDLIPQKKVAKHYKNGLCMVFRLQASDYHHFCFIDDCEETGIHFLPGLLHSVQPIALEKVPVYRRNRRFYHLLKTENFGPVMQVEVGAVLVGGVHHEVKKGKAKKGAEMGHFELCGSTVALLFTEDIRNRLTLYGKEDILIDVDQEYSVRIGEPIGIVE